MATAASLPSCHFVISVRGVWDVWAPTTPIDSTPSTRPSRRDRMTVIVVLFLSGTGNDLGGRFTKNLKRPPRSFRVKVRNRLEFGGGQLLNHPDHELQSRVVVGPIDHAGLSVRVARRHPDVDARDAGAGPLEHRAV